MDDELQEIMRAVDGLNCELSDIRHIMTPNWKEWGDYVRYEVRSNGDQHVVYFMNCVVYDSDNIMTRVVMDDDEVCIFAGDGKWVLEPFKDMFVRKAREITLSSASVLNHYMNCDN